jgi:MFS family permease
MNEFFSIALPPILPLLVADFEINYVAAGLLLTTFFATYSICQLPAGMLADRIGKRLLIAISTVGLVTGVVVASRADAYNMLIVAQIIAGVSGSAYHPAGMSLISDIETGQTEGRAMGIHGFGGIVGVALAPVVIGGVSSQYTWRLALIAAGAIGVVYTTFFVLLFPRDRSPNERVAEKASEGSSSSEPLRTRIRETLQTILQPETAKVLILLFLLHVFVSAEIRATHSFTTTFAYTRTGESTAVANGVFLALLVGSAIASLWAGKVADSVDRRWLGAGAATVTAVLYVLTGAIPTSLSVLTGWFFLIGIVMYVQAPVMNAMTANISNPTSSGSLFGVMATAGALGSAAAPALFGVIATAAGDGVAFQFIGGLSLLVTLVFLAFPAPES